jgi:hypothetical protein
MKSFYLKKYKNLARDLYDYLLDSFDAIKAKRDIKSGRDFTTNWEDVKKELNLISSSTTSTADVGLFDLAMGDGVCRRSNRQLYEKEHRIKLTMLIENSPRGRRISLYSYGDLRERAKYEYWQDRFLVELIEITLKSIETKQRAIEMRQQLESYAKSKEGRLRD